ncbi:MAG TPA: radical SAM family heme chaperone HemW [Gemmatimonadales bacterium]|nr:radical SAM family heme chaperone HemW [Gemmatimonadales bacterium]
MIRSICLSFFLMHLYVHVPFCQRRCSYCDFSIAVRKRIPADGYVDAILKEAQPLADVEIDTLYFGGGTPSLLPSDAISHLVNQLAPSIRNPQSAIRSIEITLEANPEDVTPEHAKAWRVAGVNRVSLGAQSFDDTVLKWMHRSHDAARIGAAVHALRGAGIENISLDLIFGLPEELHRDWDRDLEMACALGTPHLSLYGLTIEPRTPLDRWISRGATKAPDDEHYAAEYLAAHRRLTAAGFEFYEVSNAARDGFRSRHNSAYWSGKAYVGLGPAAHSFDGRTRRWNLRAWESYRRAIAEGRSTIESEETLTYEQQELERLYLALRTSEGLPVTARYRPLPPFTAWLVEHDGRVKCTPEGWLRLDSLVSDLAMHSETPR